MPLPLPIILALAGGTLGALADRDKPFRGALIGAGLGALGGFGAPLLGAGAAGAAAGATGAATAGATGATAAGATGATAAGAAGATAGATAAKQLAMDRFLTQMVPVVLGSGMLGGGQQQSALPPIQPMIPVGGGVAQRSISPNIPAISHGMLSNQGNINPYFAYLMRRRGFYG